MSKEVIMKVPSFSADYPKAPIYVAELIRCKECKYWQDNQEGHYPNEECPWDKGETPDPDDFCSYGERAGE